MSRYHSVRYQATFTLVQNNFSWLDLVRVSALDDQAVTGPNRWQHASAKHLQLNFAVRSRYFRHQFAACRYT
jgi:hypothetical protein